MPTSFQTPMSTYQGFNIDPAYLTPSHMAAFRPGFVPGRPSQNPYDTNMSATQSARLLAFGGYSHNVDPFAQQATAASNIATAPGDLITSGMSKAVLPAAAFGIAHYGLNKTGLMNSFATHTLSAAGRLTGGAFGGAAGFGARAAAMGMGTSVPGAMGIGALAGGGASIGAGLGTAAAFFAAPAATLAVAGGISSALNASIIDPYVSTRNGARAVKSNMINQFVSGAGGSVTGSFGVSNERAHRIAMEATMTGAKDWSLGTEDVQMLTDAGTRAGLFSPIGDMDVTKMSDGIKNMVSSIKAIVAMGAVADDMGAIDLMSKLKGAGLSNFRDMATVTSSLAGSAAVSGVSVEQLMATVGNRSQMQATQRGMLPVIGQTQAASAYAGIVNAHRSGILSAGQMAALGGVEGMTASTMDNAYNAMDSRMGTMAMVTGRGFGANGLETMLQAGGMYANNALGYEGNIALNKGAMMSEAMRTNSAHGISAGSLLRNAEMSMPMAFNSDGSIDLQRLWPIAKQMGWSENDFRTFGETLRSNSNSAGNFRMGGAIDAQGRREFMSKMERQGTGMIGNGVLGGAQIGWNKLKAASVSAGSNILTPMAGVAADVTDWYQEWSASASGVVTPLNKSVRLKGSTNSMTLEGVENDTIAANLVALANGTGPESSVAKELLRGIRDNSIDPAAARELAYELDKDGLLSNQTGSKKVNQLDSFASAIGSASLKVQKGTSEKAMDTARRTLLARMDSGKKEKYTLGRSKQSRDIDEFKHLSGGQITNLLDTLVGVSDDKSAGKLYERVNSSDAKELRAKVKSGASVSPEEYERYQMYAAEAKLLGGELDDFHGKTGADYTAGKALASEHILGLKRGMHKGVNAGEMRASLGSHIRNRFGKGADVTGMRDRALNVVDDMALARSISNGSYEDAELAYGNAGRGGAAALESVPDIRIAGQLKDIMALNTGLLDKNNNAIMDNTKELMKLNGTHPNNYSDDVFSRPPRFRKD